METISFNTVESKNITKIIDYASKSVRNKILLQNDGGSISIFAIDSGEILEGKVSLFDIFFQVLEGNAEFEFDFKTYNVSAGDYIIIPALLHYTIKANLKFKMLKTILQSTNESEDYKL